MLSAVPFTASADAALECGVGGGNQVEIGECLAQVEANADTALKAVLDLSVEAAERLDEVTGRPAAVPALNAGQAAWSAYRDAHCEFVGATFGGGSGTGIAIRSCRIEAARERAAELGQYTQ